MANPNGHVTRAEAERLFQRDKKLYGEDMLRAAEWYNNEELSAQRESHRAPETEPAKDPENSVRRGLIAAGEAYTKKRGLDHSEWLAKFNIRRRTNLAARTGENIDPHQKYLKPRSEAYRGQAEAGQILAAPPAQGRTNSASSSQATRQHGRSLLNDVSTHGPELDSGLAGSSKSTAIVIPTRTLSTNEYQTRTDVPGNGPFKHTEDWLLQMRMDREQIELDKRERRTSTNSGKYPEKQVPTELALAINVPIWNAGSGTAWHPGGGQHGRLVTQQWHDLARARSLIQQTRQMPPPPHRASAGYRVGVEHHGNTSSGSHGMAVMTQVQSDQQSVLGDKFRHFSSIDWDILDYCITMANHPNPVFNICDLLARVRYSKELYESERSVRNFKTAMNLSAFSKMAHEEKGVYVAAAMSHWLLAKRPRKPILGFLADCLRRTERLMAETSDVTMDVFASHRILRQEFDIEDEESCDESSDDEDAGDGSFWYETSGNVGVGNDGLWPWESVSDCLTQ